ncbi:MAG TPA: S8 family serine peptidase [Vicinamibacterales bacterium]
MKNKYVILRESTSRSGPRRGPRAGTAAAAERTIEVEVDEMDRRRSREVARSGGVTAVAPVMPMRLIEPVLRAADVVEPTATTSWGVIAVGADTSPFDGSGMVVAVLDTGIDASHPAFAGMQLEQKDFTGAGNGDTHGHGTHCAGTIFGRDVDGVRIGVARGVQKALIGKVLGPGGGGSDQVTNAIQWAVENGANVISMSLGIDFPGFVKSLIEQDSLPEELATTIALEGYRQNVLLFERLTTFVRARAAFGQAALIVAAAGNESRRDEDPDFEIACSPPAVSEGIISVAALEESTNGLKVANFSNTNALVSGPGVGVVSAKRGGGLISMSGTSMATPHVAGVAALWGQKLASPGPLVGEQWLARLVASATTTPLATPFDPTDVGAGLVQAPQQ